jgi:hypothetical protein
MYKVESYNSRVRTLCKILLLVITSLLLFGCLGATTHIAIKDDGSGSLAISYRVSKLVAYIGAESEDEKHIILPIREADLLSITDSIEDVDLTRHTIRDDDTDILVDATFEFASLEGLVALFTQIDGPVLSFRTEAETTTLSVVIYEGLEKGVDDNVEQMITSFFSDYELTWELSVPSTVVSVNVGETNGSTASYNHNTVELLLSESEIVWEVSW